MSKWTEFREEKKKAIAAWWKGSPRAQAAIYGYVAGAASIALLWAAL